MAAAFTVADNQTGCRQLWEASKIISFPERAWMAVWVLYIVAADD